MKNTLLLTILFFLAYSVNGQPAVNNKTVNVHERHQILDKSNVSIKGDYHGILRPENLRTPEIGKIKAVLAAANRPLSIITESWDETGLQWIPAEKSVYTYGTSSIVVTSSTWNAVSSQWIFFDKSESTLDAGGNITLETKYLWNNSTSQWIFSEKTEAAYNAFGDMTAYSFYSWNITLNQFVPVSKMELFYDADRNPTSDINYLYDTDSDTWIYESKTEYTNAGGKTIYDISYSWDITLPTPDWVNFGKTEYEYNVDGKLIQVIFSDWDLTLPVPDWINSGKTVYGYDTEGNQNLMTSFSWDITLTTPDWINSMKTESVYDTDRNITLYTISMWDETSGQWVGYNKTESVFSMEAKVTTTFNWDLINGWVTEKKTTTNYSDVTRINKNMENEINVYPNPASDYIEFNIDNISESASAEIFDIHGRKIMEIKLSDKRQIEVGKLPKGLYIYRIQNSAITTTGRFVIQ
jgi:hypothetical protein